MNSYREVELSLVGNLKDLQDITERVGCVGVSETIAGALKDIEQHSFRLAVVGEFKRGKSTFINALLGQAVLPSDILPTTATLNRVTYGLDAKVEIRYKPLNGQTGRTEVIPLADISNFVTKLTAEAENVAATIEEAVVTYPVAYCRDNVDIIDTPGLSDDANMTAVTQSVLPRVHAAIMVIKAISPFSHSEAEFLDYLLEQSLGKVLFVVSGIDRIDEDEREVLLAHIRQRIQQRLVAIAQKKFAGDHAAQARFTAQAGLLPIFGVSGLQALQAKQTGDQKLRLESGFDVLESALAKFLREESGAVALQAWRNQLLKVAQPVTEAIEQRVTHMQTRRLELNETHQIAAALIEALRQMIMQEVGSVEQTAQTAINQVAGCDALLRQEVITALDAIIGNYNITTEDYTILRHETFHTLLAGQMNETAYRSTSNVAPRVQQLVDECVEKVQAGLLHTFIAFGHIVEHLETVLPGSSALISSPKPELPQDAFQQLASLPLAQALTLDPQWLTNLFTRVRLPVGDFSWASRQMKEYSFRNQLKQQMAQEISAQLQAQGMAEHVSQTLRHAFSQLKVRVEEAQRFSEQMQLEMHTRYERAATIIEHEQAELTRLHHKVISMRSEQQSYTNL